MLVILTFSAGKMIGLAFAGWVCAAKTSGLEPESSMVAMTIAQLARSADVGVETVRYYQRRGLLADPKPRHSAQQGIRHYGTDDARRLRFIRTAQAAGFALEEIRELLDLDGSEDRARVHAIARHRIAALTERISGLQHAQAALARLSQQCASGEAGPCPIIEAFENPRENGY